MDKNFHPKQLLFAYCHMMINQRYNLYQRAIDYFGNYDSKLDFIIKVELGIFCLTLGTVGFVVSHQF